MSDETGNRIGFPVRGPACKRCTQLEQRIAELNTLYEAEIERLRAENQELRKHSLFGVKANPDPFPLDWGDSGE